jgi:N utilization substance protein B
VPPRVAINEYVEIAHSFFGGREPNLVNGLLDRLAKERREDELHQG